MLDKCFKLSITCVNAIFIGTFLALLFGHLALADRVVQTRTIGDLMRENKELRERVRDLEAAPPPLVPAPTRRTEDWQRNGVIEDPLKRGDK